jgi:uncharacterized paraquat-inducible protein A
VSLSRGIGDPDPLGGDPIGRQGGVQEEQRRARTNLLAVGTIACPHCDAPVALPPTPLTPVDALACPYCDHAAPLRDFLSLEAPSRPTRVAVRVVARSRRA